VETPVTSVIAWTPEVEDVLKQTIS